MSLRIDQIRTDGGTQSRAAINEATVAEYAEAMADENTVFPPVIVYHDGRDYWLADGFHRLEAWRRIGRDEIPVDLRQGNVRRARLHSASANGKHGLRRTNDDKRRAVLMLLEDDEWRQWSDREIARRCDVSNHLVASIRENVTGKIPSEVPAERTFTTKHGTVATMDTARIGRAAPEPEPESAPEPEPVADRPLPEATPTAAPAPEPAQLDPHLAERKKLAKLTPEALIDDVIGLRETLAEVRADNAKLKSENTRLKAELKDALSDDRGEVIRRLQGEVRHLQSEMYRANEKAAAALRKAHVLEKRVKELEGMDLQF